jgi:hypothetical protein
VRIIAFLFLLTSCGPTVREVYEQECRKDVNVCSVLADDLAKGARGPKDPTRAVEVMVQSCRRSQMACLNALTLTNDALQADLSTGIAMGTRFCEAGMASICLRLSHLYDASLIESERPVAGFPHDHSRAMTLLERGCTGETRTPYDTFDAQQCCRQLSTMVRNGNGVPADATRADELMARADSLNGSILSQAESFSREMDRQAARAERETERMKAQAAQDEANRRELGQAVVQGAQDIDESHRQGPASKPRSPQTLREPLSDKQQELEQAVKRPWRCFAAAPGGTASSCICRDDWTEGQARQRLDAGTTWKPVGSCPHYDCCAKGPDFCKCDTFGDKCDVWVKSSMHGERVQSCP